MIDVNQAEIAQIIDDYGNVFSVLNYLIITSSENKVSLLPATER